jgi:transposase
MVTRPGADTVRQHAPVLDRNGSLCRRASQKNDFRDAEAIAEAVQRPTMKFVATKTADQLDLQALPSIAESNCADNFHGRG